MFFSKSYGSWLLQEGENLFGDNMMDDYRPMPNLDRWVFVLINYFLAQRSWLFTVIIRSFIVLTELYRELVL